MRMPLKLAALAIICVAVHLSGAQEQKTMQDFEKGAWLYHACKANVRSMDASDGGTAADAALASECLEYVGGFLDGAFMSGGPFCVEHASTGTITRLYVNYMEQNPKFLDMNRRIGIGNALLLNYPCHKLTK